MWDKNCYYATGKEKLQDIKDMADDVNMFLTIKNIKFNK